MSVSKQLPGMFRGRPFENSLMQGMSAFQRKSNLPVPVRRTSGNLMGNSQLCPSDNETIDGINYQQLIGEIWAVSPGSVGIYGTKLLNNKDGAVSNGSFQANHPRSNAIFNHIEP